MLTIKKKGASKVVGTFVPLEYELLLKDMVAAKILAQIRFWYLPDPGKSLSKLRVKKDGVWYLAKSYKDWENECGLSRKKATKALTHLKDLGIITLSIFRFNNTPTNHITCKLFEIDKDGVFLREKSLADTLKNEQKPQSKDNLIVPTGGQSDCTYGGTIINRENKTEKTKHKKNSQIFLKESCSIEQQGKKENEISLLEVGGEEKKEILEIGKLENENLEKENETMKIEKKKNPLESIKAKQVSSALAVVNKIKEGDHPTPSSKVLAEKGGYQDFNVYWLALHGWYQPGPQAMVTLTGKEGIYLKTFLDKLRACKVPIGDFMPHLFKNWALYRIKLESAYGVLTPTRPTPGVMAAQVQYIITLYLEEIGKVAKKQVEIAKPLIISTGKVDATQESLNICDNILSVFNLN